MSLALKRSEITFRKTSGLLAVISMLATTPKFGTESLSRCLLHTCFRIFISSVLGRKSAATRPESPGYGVVYPSRDYLTFP